MPLIRLDNVSLRFNEKPLISNINMSIEAGDRIGIVGDNGVGKSTLLRCIVKQLEDYDGRITLAKGLRYEYVEQGFNSCWNELTPVNMLSACLDDPVTDQWRVHYVLELMNFPMSDRDLLFAQLSGGWKKMVMIAKAIIMEPDVLLLDEPTNHLDYSHIALVSSLLRDSQLITTFALISHDRAFLDAITNATVLLSGGRASCFDVPYTKAKRLLLEQEQALLSARADGVNEIERLKKSAKLQRQIGVNNYSDRALQKAKQIERKIKSLEMRLPEKQVVKDRDIALAVDEFAGKRILQIKDLNVCAEGGDLLFVLKELVVNQGDRVVFCGANGSGKSSLVRAICANNDPCIKLGPSVRVGVLDQELSLLPVGSQVLDFITESFCLSHQQAISKLASSGFSYLETQKQIGKLSYGERARLAILALRLMKPNFLIFDEPTNHLDISSQEMLESAVLRLNPAAILVSHDARFVENVGTRYFDIANGVCSERHS